jgi:hypothetical protein
VWARLIASHQARRDWRAAESATRRALVQHPASHDAWAFLGQALMQQDRDDEAAEALRRALTFGDSPATRALLAQLERQTAASRGMGARSSSHFALRYEGDADEAVGRRVLEVLERSYEDLRRTFGREPARPIPVILYSGSHYLGTEAGPAWSGGTFSHYDGRIRVRTGNLAGGFDDTLERTLVHELVHAFVAEQTGGALPRELNEGLAQYLSGVRAGPMTGAWAKTALEGRNVSDFYAAALGLVQYLIEQHRMASMTLMLETLGRTGDVDGAFRKAYGLPYKDVRADWLGR